MCKARDGDSAPPSSPALSARKANPSWIAPHPGPHPHPWKTVISILFARTCAQPHVGESGAQKISGLLSQPLQDRMQEQRRGGGGGGHDFGISSPTGPATPEEGRSEIYRCEVSDFFLLDLSAYQLHNAKNLQEALGRRKIS